MNDELKPDLQPDTLKLIRQLAADRDGQALAQMLDSQTNSVAIRRAAAKALAEVAHLEQTRTLATVLQNDSDRGVRLNAARGLGRLADDAALPALITALKDREATVRVEAAQALSRYNSQVAFDSLLAALHSRTDERDRFVRQYTAEALGNLADRRAVSALIEALHDPSDVVRPAVATALGKLGQTTAIEPLQRMRHVSGHARGFDCAECKAIDRALLALTSKPKDNI